MATYDPAYEDWLRAHLDETVRYFRDPHEARGELFTLLRHGPRGTDATTCRECGDPVPCQFQRLKWAVDTEIESARMGNRVEVADALETLGARLRDPLADIECD